MAQSSLVPLRLITDVTPRNTSDLYSLNYSDIEQFSKQTLIEECDIRQLPNSGSAFEIANRLALDNIVHCRRNTFGLLRTARNLLDQSRVQLQCRDNVDKKIGEVSRKNHSNVPSNVEVADKTAETPKAKPPQKFESEMSEEVISFQAPSIPAEVLRLKESYPVLAEYFNKVDVFTRTILLHLEARGRTSNAHKSQLTDHRDVIREGQRSFQELSARNASHREQHAIQTMDSTPTHKTKRRLVYGLDHPYHRSKHDVKDSSSAVNAPRNASSGASNPSGKKVLQPLKQCSKEFLALVNADHSEQMKRIRQRFSDEVIEDFWIFIREYVRQQIPEEEKHAVLCLALTIDHFYQLDKLNFKFPDRVNNHVRTTIYKVGRAARFLVEEGYPRSLCRQYLWPESPEFPNSGLVEPDGDLLKEYIAYEKWQWK